MHLTAGLHRSLQKHPQKIATITGARRQSFAQLAARVARVAGALQALGLQAGERVSVLAENSDRYIEVLLGCWWAGLVPNPINTRWSATEVAYALNDCGARVLCVDPALLPVTQAMATPPASLTYRIYLGEVDLPEGHLAYEAWLAAAPAVDDVRSDANSLAAIIYTGGTTGFPKGVMLSHANFWASLVGRMAETPNPPHFVTLLTSPLFHVAGLGRLLGQTIVGGTCVTVGSFNASVVTALMAQESVSDLVIVPSMLQMLLDTPGFNPQALPHLQRILWGAAPITVGLLTRAMAAFPEVEFIHAYGMTETAASVTSLRIQRDEAFLQSGRLRSAGQAGLSCEVRIADEQGQALPAGEVGEILVRGPVVMLGYWNRPEETAQAIRHGWLHTGDGGRVDEHGYVYVVDRIKDMVISGGENIYPAEIENVLSQHPGVASCAVIGVPHEKWGEAVHAVVVLRAGAAVSEAELMAHCRAHLSGFKCPKSIELRERLPLTAAGKVQKTLLRQTVGVST